MSLEVKVGMMVLAALLLFGLVATCGACGPSDEQLACERRGGIWIVTGQTYYPPTYVNNGSGGMVPVGGGLMRDWGCKVPTRGEP